ncbi:hypothetical protein Tco_0303408 [Tanacetum coccineum]
MFSTENDQAIHGGGGYTQRRLLWENLRLHKHYVRDRPWCILGDFNAALFLHDSSAGNLNVDISMREFKECVEDLEVMDVQHSGLQFTWSQKPKGKEGLLKKIDRVMANLIFNEKFTGSHAIFKPYRISDHAPSVLRIPTVTKPKPKPFKFYNLITSNENFKKLRNDLDQVQTRLDMDPFNVAIRKEEDTVLAAFNEACIMEEKFLKQKAKIDWLREGDSNSAYFHKSVKSRISRSRIDVVATSDGVVYENDKVAEAFVSHYEIFLGQPGSTTGFCDNDLFQNSLEENVALEMTRMVTRQEVKSALFSMGNEKSSGPDGFLAAFFKETWDIVADDFVAAVCEFFTNGKILRELNHTIIALIPKVSSPTCVNDYRPISCCNVIFKCISKIIANRIKESLKVLVSPNQSAFVPGRSIADNILLTQELMHNYHLDRGPPRCAFKVDIQKAYDTVDWGFLKFWFSYSYDWLDYGGNTRVIGKVIPFVSITCLRLCGNLTAYASTRLWNSVSFSTIDMFRMELINLCFADDLFLFAHGDTDSVRVIKEALVEFKEVSGLVSSLPKSKAYFCNVINFTKLAILQILTFEEGCLPVKYLGVPLVTSRLVFRDCKELIEKVQAHVDDWKNKFLSVAGRLQLIRSVLSSMHIYWASMFILPSRVLTDIEHIMRGFLWCHGSMRKGSAKVAWGVVCLPKDEGGLGVRRLDMFNKALMISHIWKLISCKESLWRKVLQIRPLIRQYVWYSIGDGASASLWFDNWCILSPLAKCIPSRDWYRAGLISLSTVSDVIHNGVWNWPLFLSEKYPMLLTLPSPSMHLESDHLEWRNELGVVKPFSVSMVWNHMKAYAGLPNSSHVFSQILLEVSPFAKRKSSRSVIAKLVLAASAYFLWQERNWRLFKNSKRTAKQVIDCIYSSVRLKLLSCRFKKSKHGVSLAQRWSLLDSCFAHYISWDAWVVYFVLLALA